MKIGDVITTKDGLRWIIFEFSNHKNFMYVTDTVCQQFNDYISIEDVIEVEEMPNNIQWLFILRRERNLKSSGF